MNFSGEFVSSACMLVPWSSKIRVKGWKICLQLLCRSCAGKNCFPRLVQVSASLSSEVSSPTNKRHNYWVRPSDPRGVSGFSWTGQPEGKEEETFPLQNPLGAGACSWFGVWSCVWSFSCVVGELSMIRGRDRVPSFPSSQTTISWGAGFTLDLGGIFYAKGQETGNQCQQVSFCRAVCLSALSGYFYRESHIRKPKVHVPRNY